jgi:hypothetical protein
MQWFFEVAEAVDYLWAIGAGRATLNQVRRLISSGAIPRIGIERKRYLKEESLNAWFLKQQPGIQRQSRRAQGASSAPRLVWGRRR